ncbi:MAG: hypothetical protein H6719_15405 [Sandaracinaceae bacterium]|nr:hypothetical protein [Sandaracinaceae bacterium]
MHRIETEESDPPRVLFAPDRRAAVAVSGLLLVYAAALGYASASHALELGPKGWIILVASLVVPSILVAQAAGRTVRLEGEELFVSGPFGLGGARFEGSRAELELTSVEVLSQSSWRLTLLVADGPRYVLGTWVADRHPLVDALRAALSPGASAAARAELARLAAAEHAEQRAAQRWLFVAALASLLAIGWVLIARPFG